MAETEITAEGFRPTCTYCRAAWGSCHCEFHEECGFVWEGTLSTKPNLDATGRFFVEPSVYYGEPYEKWLIEHEGCRA